MGLDLTARVTLTSPDGERLTGDASILLASDGLILRGGVSTARHLTKIGTAAKLLAADGTAGQTAGQTAGTTATTTPAASTPRRSTDRT